MCQSFAGDKWLFYTGTTRMYFCSILQNISKTVTISNGIKTINVQLKEI